MNIIIDSELHEESVREFVNEINMVEDKSNIVVYLNSIGGDPTLVPLLRDVMERYQVKLIACSRVFSSALDLFLTTNTPREVLDHTEALFHRSIIDGMKIDKNCNVIAEKKLKKIWKETVWAKGLPEKFLEISNQELKQVKNGKDLYFSADELRKALKNSVKYFEDKK